MSSSGLRGGSSRGKMTGTCHFEKKSGPNSVSLFENWDQYFCETDQKSAESQNKKANCGL